MGKVDTAAKRCLQDNILFADIFNYIFLSQGSKLVINPADLHEVDSQQLLSIRTGRTVLQKQRVRDIVRIWVRPNGKTMVLVLGLEIQAAIHYALPVRILTYDALSYADQVDSASNSSTAHITAGKNGLKLKLTSGEFLSGFKKRRETLPCHNGNDLSWRGALGCPPLDSRDD